jgi:hypothetical protein
MALQKTLELTNNFGERSTFPNAYIKVEMVYASKNSVTAEVGTYTKSGGNFLQREQKLFDPDLDGPNFIKQAYEHLKTLPEFAGASDA